MVVMIMKAKELRKKAYKESSLPYSFNYKIRNAFIGKKCPVCGAIMGYGEFGTTLCFPSIQHNIPISKGGKHELSNISVICKNCNVSIQANETKDFNSKEVKEIWQRLNG
mgnify:CR=1 FL=1|jgi:5-methylcytosine-specific restriction endonuclease McrA